MQCSTDDNQLCIYCLHCSSPHFSGFDTQWKWALITNGIVVFFWHVISISEIFEHGRHHWNRCMLWRLEDLNWNCCLVGSGCWWSDLKLQLTAFLQYGLCWALSGYLVGTLLQVKLPTCTGNLLQLKLPVSFWRTMCGESYTRFLYSEGVHDQSSFHV